MKYLIKSYSFYFSVIFFFSLFVSTVLIVNSFPADNEYYINGDEGTYYKQAKQINEQGLSGFEANADVFLKDSYLSLYPPPIRLVHVFLASLALKFSDTIFSLSCLSLVYYIVHCIVCFFFIKKYWGVEAALLAGIFICFSPLSCGMAGRALTESGYYLFFTLSLFSLIDYLTIKDTKKVVLFVLFFCISILIKESAIFVLPFFGGLLITEKYFLKKNIPFFDIVVMTVSPVLLSFLSYIFVFGGIDKVIDVFLVINKINMAEPHLYIKLYNSGPWYQYFVDYFMLSAPISLLFLLFAGFYLTNPQKRTSQLNILFLFFVYFLFVFSFLPQNVRYAQPVDLIYRICAALMVLQMFKSVSLPIIVKRGSLIIVFLLIISSDVSSFHNFFMVNKIYDPISYSLFLAEKFFTIWQ
ncbi:MAG: glycosyltransferase family 39 protein [Bacteroidota bacterium]